MKKLWPTLTLLLALTGVFPAPASAADAVCAQVTLSGPPPKDVALFLTSGNNPGLRTPALDTKQPGWCRATGMDLLEVAVPGGESGTRARSYYFKLKHVQQVQPVDIRIAPPAAPTLSIGGTTYKPGE